jgi:nitrite reductase/ring-hydroxylating ferredoxin subunit
MSECWITGCRVDELLEDEGFRVPVEPAIALFKVGDEFFAIDDLCTHDVASLAEGYILGDAVVECPYHYAKFSLRTGAVLSPPAPTGVRTYPTRVDGDCILIDVSSRQDVEAATVPLDENGGALGGVSAPRCGRSSHGCRPAVRVQDRNENDPGVDNCSRAS